MELTLKSRKACVFIRSLGGGGAQRVMVKYANGLHKAGVDVTILTLNKEGAFQKELDSRIPVVVLPVKRLILSLPFAVFAVRKMNPDVLFSTEPASNVLMSLVKLCLGRSIRLVLREGLFPSVALRESKYLQTRLAYRLAPYLYPIADHIVAIATELYADLIDNFGLDVSKVSCIPINPVVSSELKSMMLDEVDHEWIKSGSKRYIVSVGRLEHQKDFGTLIKAFAILRETQDVGLIVVGDGSELDKLKELAGSLGVAGEVDFVGFKSNPYPFMYRSETLVMSSIYEGLPNTLIEAIACGLYPVSTDCPSGPRDILGDDVYGKLVAMGDEHGMAKAIEEVINSNYDRSRQFEYSKKYTLDESIKCYLPKLFSE